MSSQATNSSHACAVVLERPLRFHDRDYRLTYAEDPGPPHHHWGTLRTVDQSVTGAREECITCDSALQFRGFPSCRLETCFDLQFCCRQQGVKQGKRVHAQPCSACSPTLVWESAQHMPQRARACAASRGTCKHMLATNAAAPRLSDEARHQQFDRFFDYEREERRLTCKSRAQVDVCMATSDRHRAWQGALRIYCH